MICYKDQTFCEQEQCKDYLSCERALTDRSIIDACNWWGSPDPPISVFAEKPKCFKEKTHVSE